MSEYSQLYVFVEGPDDKRFFERIFQETFEEEYSFVKTIEYSRLQLKIVANFIKTFVRRVAKQPIGRRNNKRPAQFKNFQPPD